MSEKKLVSLILAVRNEAAYIGAALDSLCDQETSEIEIEILIVDGCSNDGTTEIVEGLARLDPRIRFFHNPRKNTPAAFNMGLLEARGDYVCIMGAHTTYEPDYVSICLKELAAQQAVGCSGRVVMEPGKEAPIARLIAWSEGHPFGTSKNSLRNAKAGFVDTIPYPVFVRQALIEVGGYDPHLHRNQDNDLSQRLRARGHRLYLTDRTRCHYFAKATIRALARSAFINGYWNIISFRRNASSMALRHFVPLFFTFAVLMASIFAVAAIFAPPYERPWLIIPLVVLLGVHVFAGELVGIQIAFRRRSAVALFSPIVFLALHFSYGLGTLWAALTNAKAPLCAPDWSDIRTRV
jgi:glycosyltransferase involved in cell wall biosynthesis